MRVVLIHGYNANPDMNYHPWLRKELHQKGYEVIVPNLPMDDVPNPVECMKAIDEAVGVVDEETIFVGHSLGGTLALRYLEAMEAQATPRAVITVAAPWKVNSDKVKSFFMTDFDFDVVMWKAREFVVIHDEDDDKIPFNHAEKYADVLGAELVRTKGNKHYMDREYPVLLETIIKKSEPLQEAEPGKELEDVYEEVVI